VTTSERASLHQLFLAAQGQYGADVALDLVIDSACGIRLPPRRTTPIVIPTEVRVACEMYGLTTEQFYERTRTDDRVKARAIACWALRQARHSYPKIARIVGRRDHATAMVACKKVDDNPILMIQAKQIVERVNSKQEAA
jgi:chromosomal replication initiation ATPase DnaA